MKKTHELVSGLDEMQVTTDSLISLGESVNQDLVNCSKYRDELVLKHLTEHSKDDQQVMLLRENAELRNTVDEYQKGIELIMSKYREHSDGNIFDDTYAVRERYVSGMSKIVDDQDARIEHMLQMMKLTADLEEIDSEGNQRIIRQLTGENEEMRRQLQISNADPMLQQGSLNSSESSTQFEMTDTPDPEPDQDPDTSGGASSLSSLESFISCLSRGIDDGEASSSSHSVISQLEISRFIYEALADDPPDQEKSSKEPEQGTPSKQPEEE